jgi:hypothetical protein
VSYQGMIHQKIIMLEVTNEDEGGGLGVERCWCEIPIVKTWDILFLIPQELGQENRDDARPS